ncbi:MAG TPA: hypothetical protein VGV61_10060 [Thermoanaerobaculia bacterium]|nr:hypothetical protein [Thermoanaerobaculia bacterium]
MDPNRFKEAYGRLELLDDRLSYKVRSGAKARGTSPEQLDVRVRDVAEMVLELKDILREVMLAIASKPGGKGEPE